MTHFIDVQDYEKIYLSDDRLKRLIKSIIDCDIHNHPDKEEIVEMILNQNYIY